jgi:hypothetical protein
MSRMFQVVIVALAAASLLLAACGGGSSKATPTSAPSSSGTPGAGSPAATQSGGGQVTGSGAASLKKLATDLSGKTYQISYDLSMTQSGQNTAGSMTMAQKPPKSFTSYQAAAGNFLMINDGTNTYTCTKDPTGAGQCIKSTGTAGAAANPAAGLSIADVLSNLTSSVNVTDAGSRTIAGIDSQCFNVQETSGTGIACFSKSDGLATLIQSKAPNGDTMQFQATKASGSVDDSMFAPPAGYTVVTLPSGVPSIPAIPTR